MFNVGEENRVFEKEEVYKAEKEFLQRKRGNDSENFVGVCLSGGGLRSAAFSIGVFEKMIEKKFFQHIDFVSGVSGSCYFLGNFLTHYMHLEESSSKADECIKQTKALFRKNVNFINPSFLSILWNVLSGMVVLLHNFVFILCILYVFSNILYKDVSLELGEVHTSRKIFSNCANMTTFSPYIYRPIGCFLGLYGVFDDVASINGTEITNVWSFITTFFTSYTSTFLLNRFFWLVVMILLVLSPLWVILLLYYMHNCVGVSSMSVLIEIRNLFIHFCCNCCNLFTDRIDQLQRYRYRLLRAFLKDQSDVLMNLLPKRPYFVCCLTLNNFKVTKKNANPFRKTRLYHSFFVSPLYIGSEVLGFISLPMRRIHFYLSKAMTISAAAIAISAGLYDQEYLFLYSRILFFIFSINLGSWVSIPIEYFKNRLYYFFSWYLSLIFLQILPALLLVAGITLAILMYSSIFYFIILVLFIVVAVIYTIPALLYIINIKFPSRIKLRIDLIRRFQQIYSIPQTASSTNFFLSDGGHFGLVGLYELVKRKLTHILVFDAGDDRFKNDSLYYELNELINEGVIKKDVILEDGESVLNISKVEKKENIIQSTKKNFVKFTVEFQDGTKSQIYYAKATVTGKANENMMLHLYNLMHSDFPQETMSTIIFNKEQVDIYSLLGQHICEEVLKDVFKDTNELEIFTPATPSTPTKRPTIIFERKKKNRSKKVEKKVIQKDLEVIEIEEVEKKEEKEGGKEKKDKKVVEKKEKVLKDEIVTKEESEGEYETVTEEGEKDGEEDGEVEYETITDQDQDEEKDKEKEKEKEKDKEKEKESEKEKDEEKDEEKEK